MKKRELLTRIEELERRLADVEAKPAPVLPPITVPYPVYPPYPTYQPWWGIFPPTIGQQTITVGTPDPVTTSTTVGQVNAWIANPLQGMWP